MNTVERIKSICKERKIAISKLEKECGFSNGYIGQLRKGTVPDDRLRVIAKYLDLSVEYLMTGEETKSFDYLYIDGNTEFLIEFTKKARDAVFLERMVKYMQLMDKHRESVDDMIDFLHEKEQKGEA